ncbi:hypothetical protein JVT61DRAFT_13116 [Boletus reticuloceps]|uniref:Vacuolar ATPase assembly integral membrane protein VMA21 n=1 Tax=Boletus reticuloceps TaxID=495285 RepID=A0A8I2YUV9_9AGAM|nr:hypothetical protein JVT61DRAFT_13116 [Boletus reticuloceps]
MSNQSTVADVTAQAASRGALIKLLLFAATLAILPISSYFISLRYMWGGNHTYAAITAVVAANLVLVVYIVTSILEDRMSLEEAKGKKLETKKHR